MDVCGEARILDFGSYPYQTEKKFMSVSISRRRIKIINIVRDEVLIHSYRSNTGKFNVMGQNHNLDLARHSCVADRSRRSKLSLEGEGIPASWV